MKELLTFIFALAVIYAANGQTVEFVEHFETGNGQFTSSGTDGWAQNDTFSHSGISSSHCSYSDNSTNTLTVTNSIDLSGFTVAVLTFDQICKLEISDEAIVEISDNGGFSWTTLNNSRYLGSAFLLNGDQYFDGSYTDWDFNNFVDPQNDWWKHEKFDISPFISNDVLIRFSITADGSLNYFGWLLDNVIITASTTGEIVPPSISHSPIQATGSTAAVSINATITDASAIDTADLYYRVNGGSWVGPLAMTNTGSSYSQSIPGQSVGNTVDYYIRAVDGSIYHNETISPANQTSSYHTYEVVQAITSYPYVEDFEGAASQWSHKDELPIGNTGVVPVDDWQKGNPSSFNFPSAHSGSNAYVTKLFSSYTGNSRSALLTPIFDLTNLNAAEIAFYHMYDIDLGDGARIDYIHGDFSTILNNLDWKVLGEFEEENGSNWYNDPSVSSASNLQTRPGWSGKHLNAWQFSVMDISSLTGPGQFVRFRFAFTSWYFTFGYDGWMVDDFAIGSNVGIAEVETNRSALVLYPNPTNDRVSIYIENERRQDVQVAIFNNIGQQVSQIKLTNLARGTHQRELDINDLQTGYYLIEVTIGDDVYQEKMIKLQ